MNKPFHVHIVDADRASRGALCAYFEAHGLTVTPMESATELLRRLHRNRPDLVIMDSTLPGMSGTQACQRLRAEGDRVPVILLSERNEEIDRVLGLEMGADDYLTKPFDFPELELRLRALLRRSRPADAGGSQLGGLVLDHDARRASVHGVAVDLSPREWLLLDLLLAQQGKVVGKERIAQAWSVEAGEAGSTEVYIHRLRRKLEGSGLAIRTVRGLGYLLEPGTA